MDKSRHTPTNAPIDHTTHIVDLSCESNVSEECISASTQSTNASGAPDAGRASFAETSAETRHPAVWNVVGAQPATAGKWIGYRIAAAHRGR